ncbi:MAG: hypothetical protein ACKV22_29905 [Bryobacteraceae bacterium]
MFEWLRHLLGWSRQGRRRPRQAWRNDYSHSRTDPDPEFGPYVEARDWLGANAHEAPIASNRFRDRSEAESFVRRLYDLGAVRVLVGNISTEADEGGQYSDLLVVEVPFDLSRVGGFLEVWEAEFGRMDDYQASSTLLYFWWD